MKDVALKRAIRASIREILIEGDAEAPPEEPKKKKRRRKKKRITGVQIASGAVGSGRFSAATTDAGARAAKDPAGLMKDLGVKNGSGNSDLARALSIINAAIHTNPIMREAYGGAMFSQQKDVDGEPIKVIGVTPAGINNRNAIKFLSHVLQGAINAGMLGLRGGIVINKEKSMPIIVYEA